MFKKNTRHSTYVSIDCVSRNRCGLSCLFFGTFGVVCSGTEVKQCSRRHSAKEWCQPEPVSRVYTDLFISASIQITCRLIQFMLVNRSFNTIDLGSIIVTC